MNDVYRLAMQMMLTNLGIELPGVAPPPSIRTMNNSRNNLTIIEYRNKRMKETNSAELNQRIYE
jgi:hypothetical protein